jgi:cell division protein FtsN
MDIYPLVLLGLIALILLAVAAGAVYSIVSHKKAFNAVVAKNEEVKPLNYDDWRAERIAANQRKAKAIADFQALSELNNDFNAVIEGE